MEQSGFVVITGILIKKNIPEHHILPRIQDSIEQFGGNQYFTLLEQGKANNKPHLVPESQKCIAFITTLLFFGWC